MMEAGRGKRTNQTFVFIPHHTLIDMITYKAAMTGIAVHVTEESYTSGTSYLDGEYSDRAHYDIRRRIAKGNNNLWRLMINQIYQKRGCRYENRTD